MTYFHTGIRTIIGAKSFHCPVRDGKEWDQLAMVIRHNWVTGCFWGQPVEFIEPISLGYLDIIAQLLRVVSFECVSLGITALTSHLHETVKVIGSSRTSN